MADQPTKKPVTAVAGFWGVLVPVNGIELLTFALRMRCSTN